MNELINVIKQQGTLVVSSREVAENFEKQHIHVMEAIRGLETSIENSIHLFIPSTYQDSYGREQKEYLLTRDGFTLLAMGFTGKKALDWKLKYIEAFNKMEAVIKKPMSAMQLMELQFEAIKEVDTKVDEVNKDLQDFKLDLPILGIECDRITTAVKRKGVKCLGGKESEAYQDKSLRGRVYSDIYGQLKREFGISSYKAIKRSQTDTAVGVVDNYELPVVLADEIKDCNSQLSYWEWDGEDEI